MGPAASCPSRILGLCADSERCYALKAERMYPNCLPYRAEQARQWKNNSVNQLTKELNSVILHSKGLRWLRFSEAGDFESQKDVDKMSQIAHALAFYGIGVYGYTARQDLDFSQVDPNMTVCGSGFMVHNQFTATDQIEGKIVCPGDCRHCHICKLRRNINVEVLYH